MCSGSDVLRREAGCCSVLSVETVGEMAGGGLTGVTTEQVLKEMREKM